MKEVTPSTGINAEPCMECKQAPKVEVSNSNYPVIGE